jgi:peptidoglycan/xylan/chitin deacetylase (PgdA/CDA1 family)
MKRLALATLTHPVLLPLAYPFTRGVAPILMLHRFADHAPGSPGHDPQSLRRNLEFLRRHRFDLVPLAELLARMRDGGRRLYKTVAFTVDDGYADFARVGCDVFAAFDCPVTVFVVTGFLDGRCWLWWDQVDFVLGATRRTAVDVDLGGSALHYRWSDAAGREGARADLAERLKRVDDSSRQAALARLAGDLEVEIPDLPPPRYAPMTWDDARRCAGRGVTFGPHTVAHPILSRVDPQRSAQEIGDSWRRVREEVPASVPIFCYPNGDPDSFGPREQRVLGELGLAAALTTVQDFASSRLLAAGHGAGRYAVPRFPYFDQAAPFRQVVSGLERAKRLAVGSAGS